MPWWVWLLLVLLMIILLVGGCVFAVRRALHTASVASYLIENISQRYEGLALETDHCSRTPIGFTQPLTFSAQRYSDAQYNKECRKRNKRKRHQRIWEVWNHHSVLSDNPRRSRDDMNENHTII